MMIHKPKALDYFKKELEQIKDANLQTFFYNSLAIAPKSFHNDEGLMEYTKKAFYILYGFLNQRQIIGTVREALLGTTLLCDIMFNEFEDEMKKLHPVAVRTYLENHGMNKEIQQGLWENIMRAIEAHHGNKGASPSLDAKPGTAEYELAQAFIVAHMPYVNIYWEDLYNEGKHKK
ncbi:hypothetical protein CN498_21680 [Bacillus thuringiensis]|uniref:Uncharacterized protein n=1 Tax=Bacillus cereus (strain G9842) TaxID=405531 RepID=B7IZN1_BACC2|nr:MULTISPECIES: hypothetical protein [Bacillus cereus group]ACK98775.1 hypothetical protein BCG9842_A0038 [Bacillus cereus G9842]MCU5508216.1 hypothetical protein [Bacillus cereus]MDA2417056.1 hypothetical protein [Bacillus cereus]MDR4924630.1 hypothetical protein [Bacillus thuringiensis]MED3584476.1 hypothetical protein [Bacillus thuringiensis]